jgi:lambda family phage portal protein
MNLIESAIAVFAPQWAVQRAQARATLSQINAFVGSKGGYDAGKLNRLTKHSGNRAPVLERDVPFGQVQRLQADSWDLWRNNPHAKKIVRSLQSKVIGKGLHPDCMAVDENGDPHMEFRRRAAQLWQELQTGFDWRGMPAQGGLTMPDLQRMMLRAVMLTGETLYRTRAIDRGMQLQRELPVPMAIQVIDARRLCEDDFDGYGSLPEGHHIYRGIEFNDDDQRVRYWLQNKSLYGEETSAVPLSVAQVGHLYVEEDIDQPRGVPWFAPALLDMRDIGDLKYNTLKASAMAACIVLGYRTATGQQRFGLSGSATPVSGTADGTDLTDADGNAVTKIQPGMMINLGKDGALEGFNPNQPNLNAEAFAQFMLRGTGVGFPGIKSSSVTGDYRGASFSSEKAADNDTWPEVEAVQDWFAQGACQPVYAAALRRAVIAGYFDGIVSADEFASEPSRFVAAQWQGPVAQSINPEKDILAARQRIAGGVSTLQTECRKFGVKWTDVLANMAEVYSTAEQAGVPIQVVNGFYGLESAADSEQADDDTADDETPAEAAAE